MRSRVLLQVLVIGLLGTALGGAARSDNAPAAPPAGAPKAAPALTRAKATFAGGCFWCMVPPFDKLDGVVGVTSGYTGGTQDNPTYEQVSAGWTGHAESVEIVYDPTRIRYEKLLDVYWHNVDPTTPNAQFCDHGNQYRTAIFFHDEAQRAAAEASKKALEASGKLPGPIVTQIVPASAFWPAEEYHQDYYRKNPLRYSYYRNGCGRDARLKQIWGDAAPPH
jgi:peptide-methionine (S)-S-oxide reductase